MKVGPFKIDWDAIWWGRYVDSDGDEMYQWYFCWFNFYGWNPKTWEFGLDEMFYDQPFRAFSFGPFNMNWSTQWTPWLLS